MNLSQLYYFRKLAEVKHYTHAAEELFISQPTLSNSISQLEKELGIPPVQTRGPNHQADALRGRILRIRDRGAQRPWRRA